MAYRFCTASYYLKPHLAKFLTNNRHSFVRRYRITSQISRCLIHLQNYCEQLPKGFEKYYPGGGVKPPDPVKPKDSMEDQQESSGDVSNKKQNSSTNYSGPPPRGPIRFKFPSSKKSGKNPFNPDDDNRLATYAVLGAVGLLILIAYNELLYKEVTWKEFVNSYLSRNIVEKLEVVNKKWVRIRIMPGNQTDGNYKYWFNIGSVDTFERNLENAQLEMNLEPTNFFKLC